MISAISLPSHFSPHIHFPQKPLSFLGLISPPSSPSALSVKPRTLTPTNPDAAALRAVVPRTQLLGRSAPQAPLALGPRRPRVAQEQKGLRGLRAASTLSAENPSHLLVLHYEYVSDVSPAFLSTALGVRDEGARFTI